MDSPPELTPAEAAKQMGRSRNFVMKLIKAKQLRAYDLASPGSKQGRYRIPPAALEEWKQSRDVRTPSDEDVRLRSLPRLAGAVKARLAARRAQRQPSIEQRRSA